MLTRNIRIGFLASDSIHDKRASSGTMYTMARVLESTGAQVIEIPVRGETLIYRIYRKAVKEAVRFFPRLKSRLPRRRLWSGRIAARRLDMGLVDGCDVLFAPMKSGVLCFLETKVPVIYFSDATFHLMIDYYWYDLPKLDLAEGELIERTAIGKAAALVYPCRWAADSAVKDYGQTRDKITLAYFGPNIDPAGITPHIFIFDGHLDLLFVGVDWKRKGGDIAVAACKWLNDNGVDATLHVVGIKSLDPGIASLPYVENHGFLNKNIDGDYSKLMSLYDQTDCFLLPTLAECTGVSFCEASAYGLPCFTHDTGGVGDYVLEGESGHLLPLGSSGEDFGKAIKRSLEDGEMRKLSIGASRVAKERLNWDAWADSMEEVIEKVAMCQASAQE